jgi:molybdopterin/thiamine biosynthesis adenylyltransferase
VVDDALVSRADLGNNFFVTEESVGKPRAEVVRDTVLELNSSVKGNAVVKVSLYRPWR